MKNLILILFLGFASCNATDIANPEQTATIEKQDAQLKVLEAEAAELEDKYLGALAEAKALTGEIDTMTKDEFVTAVTFALDVAETARLDFETKISEWSELADERGALVKGIIDDAAKPFIPFIPPGPLQYIVPGLVSMLFPRPRHVIGKTMKYGAKMEGAKALKAITLELVGLISSRDDENPGPPPV